MRKLELLLLSFFTAALLLLGSGCRADPEIYQGTSSVLADAPPSPELMEYAEDFGTSMRTRGTARSWKTEIDDVRDGRPVHIVTEAVCPDRYHVRMTGGISMETVYIGRTMYQREDKWRWTQKQMAVENALLAPCRNEQTAGNMDPGQVRMLAESFREIELGRPEVREISGRKCRLWNVKDPEAWGKYTTTNCFDVQTRELVQSVRGAMTTLYYWNIPLDIKAPM